MSTTSGKKYIIERCTHIHPNMNRRPSTHVHRLYRVGKPSKVSMNDVRKRHANRPVVLAEENGQSQGRVSHIFAHVPRSLGEPGDLRDDGAPRQIGSVVQNHDEVSAGGHRV